MSPRKPATLAEAAIGKLGVVKGARVLAFMVSWSQTTDAIGHAPTVAEYATFWHQHERTVYRDLARFRECFEHEVNPTRLMTVAAASYDLERGVKGLGELQLGKLGVVL